MRSGLDRLVAMAAMVVAAALGLLGLPPAPGALGAEGESLSVNLASVTGPATGVGEGFLYGISQDGTQPADQYMQPLHINAFRGGGWFSGGWIKDGYQYGPATRADIASIIAQAKRLERPPYHHVQYQMLVSDLYGANAGQPANTMYPCTNGDCSNWVTFIDSTVSALQASGLKFAYDIWNEPELSIFWKPGVNTAQYFQMWDTAYREIRRIAPGAKIVGPSFAFTPQRNPGEWQTWLAHVKAAGTVPDMITNHDEGDVDDPVTVSQAIDADVAAAGLPPIPLSANEYQPADRQTAGVTAWYDARFAQSGYTNAMRGNWQCCMIPNLTGILAHTASGWAPTGNWWAMRAYADLTGSLVSTSGQVGTTAISAAKDASRRRAVAIIGDSDGYTGDASVTFTGLSSAPWLEQNGNVHVTVYRIPDQSPLYSPQVVFDQTMSASGGSVTVPFTFQAAHDAFAVYLSWTHPQVVTVHAPAQLTAPGTYHIPVTLTNGSGVTDHYVRTTLAVSADDPSAAGQLQVTCDTGNGATCPPVPSLAPGHTATATFTVTVPATAPAVSYRLTGTVTAQVPGGQVTAQNSADTQVAYCCTLTLQRVSGSAAAVRVTFANTAGDLTASNIQLSLSVPSGLTASPAGPTTITAVPPGGTGSATWDISGSASTPGALQATASYTISGHSQTVRSADTYLSLAGAFTNPGISDDSNTGPGNLDGAGYSLSAQALAAAGVTPGSAIQAGGLSFTWPNVPAGQPDNVAAGGQAILVNGTGSTLGFLVTATFGPADGTGTVYYTDGTSQSFTLSAPDWYSGPTGAITMAYRNAPGNAQDHHPVQVYEDSVPLAQGKTVQAVMLPNSGSLHVFAMSTG